MLAKRAPHAGERGQTLPLWVLGSLAFLTLSLFLVNYANIIRWQIRAQNAADAIGGAPLSTTADYFNGLTMDLYAADLDEMRLRYLDQAIVNNLKGVGCSTYCDHDYDYLVVAYNNAQAAYVEEINLLDTVTTNEDNVTQFQAAALGAWQATVPGTTQGSDYLDCGDGDDDYKVCTANTDPAFTYYALDVPGVAGLNGVTGASVGIGATNTVDVASCADIPLVQPKFLHLTKSTFRAVGRAALGLIPTPETFTVSNLVPSPGASPYQPNEDPPKADGSTDDTTSAYTVDFSTLTFTVNFYAPGPIAPYTSFNPFSFAVPSSLTSPAPCPVPTASPGGKG